MRILFLCSLLLLGVPQVAAAAGAIGPRPETLSPRGEAIERIAAPVAPTRKFDLGIDRGELRLAQDSAEGAQGGDARRPDRKTDRYDGPADRGLSFGLEVRPRSRFGALARQDDTEDPSLGDQVEKLIERPVFGLRGRYRF